MTSIFSYNSPVADRDATEQPNTSARPGWQHDSGTGKPVEEMLTMTQKMLHQNTASRIADATKRNHLDNQFTILDALYKVGEAISEYLPDVPELDLIATEVIQTLLKLELLETEGKKEIPMLLKSAHNREDKYTLFNQLGILYERLQSRTDVLVVSAMVSLKANAVTGSKRHSNADIPELFNTRHGDWERDGVDIYLHLGKVSAAMTLHNADNAKVVVRYVQTDDFPTACEALEEYLNGFSRPINHIFSSESWKSPSPTGGQIEIQTPDSSTNRIMLWVRHNVFLRTELLTSNESKPVAESFQNLTENLHSGIERGFAEARETATFPSPPQITGRRSFTVGEVFTLTVTVDQPCLQEVFCESDNVTYGDSNTSHEGSTDYTFLATEEGDAVIIFCFAHQKTFNYIQEKWSVEITGAGLLLIQSDSDIESDDEPAR